MRATHLMAAWCKNRNSQESRLVWLVFYFTDEFFVFNHKKWIYCDFIALSFTTSRFLSLMILFQNRISSCSNSARIQQSYESWLWFSRKIVV